MKEPQLNAGEVVPNASEAAVAVAGQLAGNKAGINWGDIVKPIPQDLIAKGSQFLREKNYSAIDKLAADGKLGPTAHFFGSVVHGMVEMNKLSAQADLVTAQMMGSFMELVVKSNDKVIQNYHEIRLAREGKKGEALAKYFEIMDKISNTLQRATDALIEGKLDKEKFEAISKGIESLKASAETVIKQAIESYGKSGNEDLILSKIQETNASMVDLFTKSMMEITKSRASVVKIIAESIRDVATGGAKSIKGDSKPQLTGSAQGPVVTDVTDQPVAKPAKRAPPAFVKPVKSRVYTEYKAQADFNAEEASELSFKQGDKILVYNEKVIDTHRWFKAVNATADGQPGDKKGLVPPDYLKKK